MTKKEQDDTISELETRKTIDYNTENVLKEGRKSRGYYIIIHTVIQNESRTPQLHVGKYNV